MNEQLRQVDSQNNIGQNNYYQNAPIENLQTKTSIDTPLPYLEMGTGFIIGMAIGFIIKKSFKLILFILGFSLIMIFFLESQGLFTINDKVLEESIANGSQYFDYLISALKERVSSFPSAISISAGFLIGLKFG